MSAIILESDLGIEAAIRLKTQLVPALTRRRQVVLNAAGVTRLHAAAMQILVAFVRERGAAARKTRIADPSPVMLAAAGALGVTRLFCPHDQGAAQ